MMKAAKWLFMAALFSEVSGILMVVGALLPATLVPVVSVLFGDPVVLDAPARLGVGIAGAVLAGWGCTLALLARSVGDLSAHALGTATACGVVLWFILDGIISVATGAALNVVGNVLYLVMLLVPALKLRDSGHGVHQTA